MPRAISTNRPGHAPKGSVVQPGGPLDAKRPPQAVLDCGPGAAAIWCKILGPKKWGRVAGESDEFTLVRYCEMAVWMPRLRRVVIDPESSKDFAHLSHPQKITLQNNWGSHMHRIEMEYTRRMQTITSKDPKADGNKKLGAAETAGEVPWTERRVN